MIVVFFTTILHLKCKTMSYFKHYVQGKTVNNCTISYNGNQKTFGSCCGNGLREVLAQIIIRNGYDIDVVGMTVSGIKFSQESLDNCFNCEDRNWVLKEHLDVCCPEVTYMVSGIVLQWLSEIDTLATN